MFPIPMKSKYLLLAISAALVLTCTCSSAQDDRRGRAAPSSANIPNRGNGLDNPDWTEEASLPPPAFSKEHLIPIDMPSYVSIKVGVDPDTILVGADGVVRYVIAMTNASGSTSAVYEGIRCITDEVKTYARMSASGTWSMVQNPVWKAVNDNMPSRHAQAFARQGGCQNRAATSKREIIDALKAAQKPTQGRPS
jgi:hypothetical protein